MKRAAWATLLLALLASGCGETSIGEAANLRVAVASAATPLLDDILAAYDEVAPNVSFDVTRGNAETVAMAVGEGRVDWGLVTYLPASSDLWSVPVGTDALAVIVHRQNPLDQLGLNDLRAIYQGHLFNWQALGGPDQLILSVSREQGSATRGAFDETVMAGLPTSPAARLATEASAVTDVVAQEPGAIGYVSLALVDARVRVVAIDGMLPTRESASSGAYPLSTSIRFVARAEPDGANADLLRWLLSDDGQAVVGQGYAPLPRPAGR